MDENTVESQEASRIADLEQEHLVDEIVRNFDRFISGANLGDRSRNISVSTDGYRVEAIKQQESKLDESLTFLEQHKELLGGQLATAEGRDFLISRLSEMANATYIEGAPYAHRAKELVSSLIAEHIKDIQADIENPDNKYLKSRAFYLVESLRKLSLEMGEGPGENWRKIADDFIEHNASLVFEKMGRNQADASQASDPFFNYAPGLKLMALYGSEAVKEKSVEFIAKKFKEPSGARNESPVDKVVSAIVKEGMVLHRRLGGFKLDISEEGIALTQRIVEAHKVSWKEFVSAWVMGMSGEPEKLPSHFTDNLESLRNLDHARPGAVKALSEDFGLRNLVRYETGMLIRQFDEMSDKESPYGVVVHPFSDHNGAFQGNKSVLFSLSDQLKANGYLLRVIEANGTMNLARRLVGLEKTYPRKIDFAVIGGHGEKNSIQFGEGSMGSLSVQDLGGKGVQGASRFFNPDAPFILSSCSTGIAGGIGERLSTIFGREVTAPDRPTALKSIQVKTEDSKLNFHVEYYDGDVKQVYSP